MSVATAPSHTFPLTNRQSIDTSPAVSECTVAQAARFLDVPEGYVNEMLNAGRVVYRLDDGERLIEWDSLRDYEQEWKRRFAGLAEMVCLDQEMGLYDD
ncbi:MAG: hypothetical protein FWE95_09235 [Planctomycetaceae bacterium]|nr:hypothetical protein [Planctomycetaceae bacterium]